MAKVSATQKLFRIRNRGTKVLQALIDDPETVESELKWVSDLLDGLRAWPEMREQFEPIGTITRKESDWALPHIAQAEPEDDEHRDALLCHAVRMFRLNAFCRRLADEAPLKPRLRRGPARNTIPARSSTTPRDTAPRTK